MKDYKNRIMTAGNDKYWANYAFMVELIDEIIHQYIDEWMRE